VILNGATISDPALMSALTRLATEVVGHDVELNGLCSGDRTPDCNRQVNGAGRSPHLTNQGADIHVVGMSNNAVAHAAAGSGLFTGVELVVGSTVTRHGPHAHVDIKPRRRPLTTWTERADGKSVPGLPSLSEEQED